MMPTSNVRRWSRHQIESLRKSYVHSFGWFVSVFLTQLTAFQVHVLAYFNYNLIILINPNCGNWLRLTLQQLQTTSTVFVRLLSLCHYAPAPATTDWITKKTDRQTDWLTIILHNADQNTAMACYQRCDNEQNVHSWVITRILEPYFLNASASARNTMCLHSSAPTWQPHVTNHACASTVASVPIVNLVNLSRSRRLLQRFGRTHLPAWLHEVHVHWLQSNSLLSRWRTEQCDVISAAAGDVCMTARWQWQQNWNLIHMASYNRRSRCIRVCLPTWRVRRG